MVRLATLHSRRRILNHAGGLFSFAAGNGAQVRDAAQSGTTLGDAGTFVWADDSIDAGNGYFSSTGINQFLVRSVGGVAINGAPVSPNVELTIVGNGNLSNNYSNIFLRQSGVAAGYLVSAGEATGSNNNAAFYIDQYDGTSQTRRLSLAANGDFTVSAGAFKPGGGSWAASSDARLKTNVYPLIIRWIGCCNFVAWVSSTCARSSNAPGRQARRIHCAGSQRAFPEWVGKTPDGYFAVGPTGFEALSVEALRQLREEKDAEIADCMGVWTISRRDWPDSKRRRGIEVVAPGRRIGVTVIAVTFASMCANPTFAAQANADARFELSGVGTLILDPPTLHDGNRQLKASLTRDAADIEKSDRLVRRSFRANGQFRLVGGRVLQRYDLSRRF